MTLFTSKLFTGKEAAFDEKSLDADVRTTDDTLATAIQLAIAEGQMVRVRASVIAQRSDGGKHQTYETSAAFYRNSGGNVTIKGVPQDIAAHGSDYEIQLVANTSAQTVDLKVQGINPETIDWKCRLLYTIVTNQ